MNKKEIDILELMRESIIRANKELGFDKKTAITEQAADKTAFDEPFDAEKHMPKFQVSKEWGLQGTTDANQIDAIIANIVDSSEQNGLARYKKTLAKMNDILGKSYATETSLPTEKKPQGQFNLNEIVSSMQLKSMIHAIIGTQDPKVAGKLYESLLARIGKGFQPSTETYSIEDFIDGQGNYISVKTIRSGSGITGSKTNLAIALAKKGEVYYLVNVKDSEENPFKVSAFSFKVTKGNFFYFITGKKDYKTAQEQMSLIKDRLNIVRKELGTAKQEREQELEKVSKALDAEEAPQKQQAEYLKEAYEAKVFQRGDINQNVINAYKKVYPSEQNVTFETIKNKFNEILKSASDSISSDAQQKNFLDNLLKLVAKTNNPSVLSDSLYTVIPGSGSDKMFKEKSFMLLQGAVEQMDSTPVEKMAHLLETDPKLSEKIKKLFFKPEEIKDNEQGTKEKQINDINAEISNNKSKYTEIVNKVRKNLSQFNNLYETLKQSTEQKIDKKTPTDKYDIAASAKKSGEYAGSFEKDLESFWNEVEGVSLSETFAEMLNEEKSSGGATQFEISIQNAKKLAGEDASANFDESYEPIVVAYEGLKDSVSESALLFKKWAEPIYEGMHYLTQGINQYFIEDSISGLTVAKDKGVDKVDAQIKVLSKTPASAIKTQIPESLKESIKKSALDDILIELLD
jgi:hypothetical protein